MIEVVVIPLNVVSSDPVKFAEITDVPEDSKGKTFASLVTFP